MISWIQRTFQQHFKFIFGILLIVTIVSFVMTIGNMPGLGQAGPKTIKRSFFGYDLDQQGTANMIFGDANISAQLQTGFANLSSEQIQNYAFQRIAALSLADRLKIPQPTHQEVSHFIEGLPAFAGQDGKFDPSRYASFRDNLQTNPRISEGDIARVLSQDVRIEEVRRLLAGPGYVLPDEVRDQLVRTDSKWTIGVASVDFASFKPEIPVSEDALNRYFRENSFRYVIPPRVGVDYVFFPAADYLSKVKVTPAEVRAYYDANPSRFPAPSAAGADQTKLNLKLNKPADTAAAFAAVEPKVEAALKEERAEHMAAEAAADLTVAIYNQKLSPGTADFTAFLAARNLALKKVAPFDQATAPKDLGWTPTVIQQALSLGADHAVSDSLSVAGGSIVLFWRQTLPSYQPPLQQVRDRVVADFKANQRRELFVALGRKYRADLEAGLKSGETFAAVAAKLPVSPDQPKLEVKDYSGFTLREPPEKLNPAILNALMSLQPGQVSDMVLVKDQGYLVFAQDRKLPDLNPGSPLFAAAKDQIASLTSRIDQNLYLSEIVSRELKKAAPPSS